jgi:hypothetical protein
MALSEGLHIERTEFLIADQSKDAQDLMIELPGDHRCHRRAASLQPRHVPASAENRAVCLAARRTGGKPARVRRSSDDGNQGVP